MIRAGQGGERVFYPWSLSPLQPDRCRSEGMHGTPVVIAIVEGRDMETEPESVTQTRVRLYRKALEQQREENAAKEAEAQSGKEPGGPESDHAHSTADDGSDKA